MTSKAEDLLRFFLKFRNIEIMFVPFKGSNVVNRLLKGIDPKRLGWIRGVGGRRSAIGQNLYTPCTAGEPSTARRAGNGPISLFPCFPL